MVIKLVQDPRRCVNTGLNPALYNGLTGIAPDTNQPIGPYKFYHPPTDGNNLYAVIVNQNLISNDYTYVSSISQPGASWSLVHRSVSTGVASTVLGSPLYGQSIQAIVEIWTAENIKGASQTVEINLVGTPCFGAVANIFEYSGLAINSLDTFGSATTTYATAGTSASTGTPPTPTTVANELWLGGICSYGPVMPQPSVRSQGATVNPPYIGAWQPTNGFELYDGTLLSLGEPAIPTLVVCSVLLKTVSTLSSASNPCSSGVTCGNSSWAGCIAAFKGA